MNYNAHIAQYLTNQRQQDNEIWSVNRISQEKGKETSSRPLFVFEKIIQNHSYLIILLSDQISLSGCLYFLRYWAICVLQLFVNQIVMLKISKLT